ncbi:uncharacterized protein FTOL_00345 [Fusarium torulosum]|uniref:Nucleoside phosphorylase domain-containing protein n=1 Tax=Fusarium torulosum TaxID=33205 RepID=A0AAE8LXX8_9HYPO|nr:uncharacterized protein FTOL_00345 [Fusarium torulosum]
MSPPPKSRDDFHIGIVCALPLEYDALDYVIDEFWDSKKFGRLSGDPNIYTHGRIGDSNVVVVLLMGMGKVNAASATGSMRSSYPSLELVLLTGICGGVPMPGSGNEQLLGDVIVSKAVVQYDFGRHYPEDFAVKDTLEECMRKPTTNIRNFIGQVQTDRAWARLEDRAAIHLDKLQITSKSGRRPTNYQWPGADRDRLFGSSYSHRHVSGCDTCSAGRSCQASRTLSCLELGCENKALVQRRRVEHKRRLEHAGRIKEAQAPSVFFGTIGSADTVLKYGLERDRLAKAHNLIAFEMEGAGVWNQIPCIIVKGICDYADSHKNKYWQNFAAATAASVSKALIEQYPQTDRRTEPAARASDVDEGRFVQEEYGMGVNKRYAGYVENVKSWRSSEVWDQAAERDGCVIMKSVCDYVDGRKSKSSQDFAAATAAAV